MQKTVIRTGRDKPVYLTLFEQGYNFVKVQNYTILKSYTHFGFLLNKLT